MEGGMFLHLVNQALSGLTFYHIPVYRAQLEAETSLDLSAHGKGSYLAAVDSPMINSCSIIMLHGVNSAVDVLDYAPGYRWTVMTFEQTPVCGTKIRSGAFSLPLQLKRIAANFVATERGVQTYQLGSVQLMINIAGSTHCGQSPDAYSILYFAKKFMIRA